MNTRTDSKIKQLIRKHGLTGYGIFWAIVEDLYNNANELESDFAGIAYDLRESEEIIKSVIKDFELFVIDGNKFGSVSVQRRLEERYAKSGKARASVLRRWPKSNLNTNVLKSDTNVLHGDTDSNTIKDNKIKDTESKVEKESIHILPEQIEEYEIMQMLVPEMFEAWKAKRVNYQSHKETDYQALLQIAYHIAKLKEWKRPLVVSLFKDECITEWKSIIDFTITDSWFSDKTLHFIATPKHWLDLVNKRITNKNGNKNNKPALAGVVIDNQNRDYGNL